MCHVSGRPCRVSTGNSFLNDINAICTVCFIVEHFSNTSWTFMYCSLQPHNHAFKSNLLKTALEKILITLGTSWLTGYSWNYVFIFWRLVFIPRRLPLDRFVTIPQIGAQTTTSWSAIISKIWRTWIAVNYVVCRKTVASSTALFIRFYNLNSC